MGDRANVAVVQDSGNGLVYLYTHWGGTQLASNVQRALSKHWRWSDGPYLTRIIFETIVDGQHGTETGYGISSAIGDNEHSIVVVNPIKQTIGFAKEGNEPSCYIQWSFENYLKLGEGEIAKEYDRD